MPCLFGRLCQSRERRTSYPGPLWSRSVARRTYTNAPYLFNSSAPIRVNVTSFDCLTHSLAVSSTTTTGELINLVPGYEAGKHAISYNGMVLPGNGPQSSVNPVSRLSQDVGWLNQTLGGKFYSAPFPVLRCLIYQNLLGCNVPTGATLHLTFPISQKYLDVDAAVDYSDEDTDMGCTVDFPPLPPGGPLTGAPLTTGFGNPPPIPLSSAGELTRSRGGGGGPATALIPAGLGTNTVRKTGQSVGMAAGGKN